MKPEPAEQLVVAPHNEWIARALFNAPGVLLALLTPQGDILDANLTLVGCLGASVDRLKGTAFWTHVPTPSRSGMRESVQRVVDQRQPLGLECGLGARWYQSSLVPVTSDAGLVIGVTFVAWATERKRDEEAMATAHLGRSVGDLDRSDRRDLDLALRENEERYRQIFEVESDAIFVLDWETGRFVDANPAALRLYGYAHADFLRLKHEDVSAEPEATHRAIANQERVVTFRRHRKKDGTVFPVEITGNYFKIHGRTLHVAAIRDITERKCHEEALARSEALLRAVLEYSHDAIGVHVNGIWVACNPAALRLFGVAAAEELIGTSILEVMAPAERTRISAYVQQRMTGADAPTQYLTRGMRRDGVEFDMEVALSRFALQSQSHVLVILRDITERKRMEEALQRSAESNERLRRSLIALNACLDLDSALTCLVQEVVSLGCMDAGAVYSIHGQEAVLTHQLGQDPDFMRQVARRPLSIGYLKAALEEPNALVNVVSHLPDPRRLAEVHGLRHVYCMALREQAGPFGFLILSSGQAEPPPLASIELARILVLETGSLIQRLRAEERLQELSAEQRLILDTIVHGVDYAKNRVVQWANPAHDAMLGYGPGETAGLPTASFYARQADYEAVGREGYAELAKGGVYSTEVLLLRKDGSQFWSRIAGRAVNPAHLEDGGIWVLQDITALKLAEESLREGESRFQALFDQSLLGAAQMETRTGKFVRVNRRLCDLLGYTAEELQHLAFQAVTHPEDLAISLDSVRRLVAGDTQHKSVEKRYVRKDGSILWANLTTLPLWKTGRDSDFHLALVEDVTVRRQLEERLRQSQKLEGIGHLAGGMAHEFNNILAAMLMNLGLCRTGRDLNEVREHLAEVEGLCRRSSGLIKQLLAFSQQSVMAVQAIELAATVARQCQMLGPLLGENIKLEFSSGDRPAWVKADQGMIEQVILNLCLNARDAMKNDGEIRLALGAVEVAAERAAVWEGVQAGPFVCLSVTDTGCGMDEPTLKRLFEPFFTTKEVGKGTGLGLATVRGMIQQHHGWVEVESTAGKGSTFRMYLPAAPEPPAVPRVAPPKAPVRGKGTLLLVEDEPALRKAARLVLARHGYVVFEAATGKEALEVWEAQRAEIDLIFTDMVMPGRLTGLELVQKALAEQPTLKAILTSGYHTDQVNLSQKLEPRIVYLPKPYDFRALISLIQQHLEKEQPAA